MAIEILITSLKDKSRFPQKAAIKQVAKDRYLTSCLSCHRTTGV